jgi:hypothetical protein
MSAATPTADERATLVSAMVAAKENGDEVALHVLAELAKNPRRVPAAGRSDDDEK